MQLRCGTAALGTETKGSDQVLPVQCRMARAAIGLSARKLAAAAKVSPETVIRFERGDKIRGRTVDSLREVLEAAGLEFIDGRKPGVRLSANLGR